MTQIPDERIKIYNNGGDHAFPGFKQILEGYDRSELSRDEIDTLKESFDIEEFKKNSEI